MRIVLFVLGLLPFFILSPIIWLYMIIVRALDKEKGQEKFDRMAFRCIRFACNIASVTAGVRKNITGLENIPEGPVVYILNHQGIFDIITFYTLMKTPTGFIAKDNLKKAPILSTWIRYVRGLFLNRKNVEDGLRVIMKGVDYLKEGISMCIFPEGTRNKGEDKTEVLPFHGGSFKLAQRTGFPIVPVTIYNTAECFENHKPWMKSANVYMDFGKSIYIKELPKEEQRFIADKVRGIIGNRLKEIAQTVAENEA